MDISAKQKKRQIQDIGVLESIVIIINPKKQHITASPK
jgi:hypothetical protein